MTQPDYIHCPVEDDHPLMESCGCGYAAERRSFPKEEPAADVRVFARAMRGMFVALQQEGFTVQEALVVVGQVIAAGMGGKQ